MGNNAGNNGSPLSLGGVSINRVADADGVTLASGSITSGVPTVARTYTLPPLASVGSGSRIQVYNNGAATITITADGTDQVNDAGAPGTHALAAGAAVEIEAKVAVGGVAGSWFTDGTPGLADNLVVATVRQLQSSYTEGNGSSAAGTVFTRVRAWNTQENFNDQLTWVSNAADGAPGEDGDVLQAEQDMIVGITFTFLSAAAPTPAVDLAINRHATLNNAFAGSHRRSPHPVGTIVPDSTSWTGYVRRGDYLWASTSAASATGVNDSDDFMFDVSVLVLLEDNPVG